MLAGKARSDRTTITQSKGYLQEALQLANHKSAIKRHTQSEKRRARNASIKSEIRTVVKKVREAVEGAKPTDAKTLLQSAVTMLDRAVSKGTLHRNNAARKISRLTKAVVTTGTK